MNKPVMELSSPLGLSDQPRARGRVHVGIVRDRLKDLHQSGSLKAVFPHGQAWPQVVLVNTAGGITGGDRFDTTVAVGDGSRLTVTTQAAERIYAAPMGSLGRVTNTATVSDTALLEWLPQETIVFQAGALMRRQHFDLAPTSRALIVEPLIFGRPAMGEIVDQARHRDDLQIHVQGRLIFRDAFTLTGSDVGRLRRQGFGAMAALHYFAAQAVDRKDGIQAILPDTAGVSAVSSDLITCRFLAADGFALRKALLPVIEHLTEDALPKVWRL